jgi:hypothetical protein
MDVIVEKGDDVAPHPHQTFVTGGRHPTGKVWDVHILDLAIALAKPTSGAAEASTTTIWFAGSLSWRNESRQRRTKAGRSNVIRHTETRICVDELVRRVVSS